MVYARRIVDDVLDDLIPGLPAVLLDGPKGVGKTETALQRATSVFRLDDPAHLQIVQAAPELALAQPGPVLFDEWQRMPPIWDAVKRVVDSNVSGIGPFILTGSAYVPGVATHSGAGRIHELRMRPMTLPERGVSTPTVSLKSLFEGGSVAFRSGNSTMKLADYVEEIVASGFPGIRTLSKRVRRAQLDSYVAAIVQKDIREAGHSARRPQAVMAWLRGYAAATATSTSWEKIRNAANQSGATPARSTLQPYIEVLQMLRILDEVPAWLPSYSPFANLGQASKHHLADPALSARLLGMTTQKLISGEAGEIIIPRDGTLLGALFESLVTLSVRVFAQPINASVSHLRTKDTRHEVDLIVESEEGGILGIEVKLSPLVTDDDVRHLLWLRENAENQIADLVVVTTGDTAYRRPDGIAVIPLALLGP